MLRTPRKNGLVLDHGRAWSAACIAGLAIVLTLSTAGRVGASGSDAMPIPAHRQVPIFFKLLTYDRTLVDEARGLLRIAILHDSASASSQDNRSALQPVLADAQDKTIGGLPLEIVELEFESEAQLTRALLEQAIHIVYVTAGQGSRLDQITAATRASGTLSMTGVAKYVEDGVGVGLDLEDQRPRIVLNLTATRAEGHEFSSNLLRLCRIVR